jgi:hypothetical protein
MYIVENMINKIIKEKRRSMNAAPTDPATRSPGGPQTKTGKGRKPTK